ncbi:MAG: PD-(D/E)XK nuclease family protein [Coriobacteriia bacterium]|nr:PD-(D/E)XK nuclease family protein [Coriobacteriia bacterium]
MKETTGNRAIIGGPGITLVLAGPSNESVRTATDGAMEALLAQGMRVARVLPDARRATQTAKRLAAAGSPLLGTPVTTLDEWALERWALFGDGRTPAFSAERRALVLQAIGEARPRTSHLPADSRGIVGCVESMVRTATGTLAFDRGVALDTERLSEAQLELLDICHIYARLLSEHGLVERSAALASLPDTMGDAGWSHLLLEDVSELGAVQESLIAAAARHEGATLVIRWREQSEDDAARAEMAQLVARANGSAASCDDALAPDESAGTTATAAAHDAASGSLAGAGHDGAAAMSDDARAALGELLERLHPAYAKLRGLVEGLVGRQGLSVRLVRAEEPPSTASVPRAAAPKTSTEPVAPSPELAALRHALFQPSSAPTVVPTGTVRFVLPAGRYARSEALAREIVRLRGTGIAPRDIVIACADPLALADALSGRLACADIACVAAGIEPLALTNAGRALAGLVRLVETEALASPEASAPDLVPLASDLALNPLLGVSDKEAHKQAHVLDAAWRANRLASASDLLAGLAGASAVARSAIAALRSGSVSDAVSALVRASKKQGVLSQADLLRDEPGLASLAHRVSVATELAGPIPVSSDAIARLMDGASVRTSRLSVPPNSLDAMREATVLKQNPNAVRLMRLRDVAGQDARAVIACDLTADDYPFSDRSDAASALLGKLGLPAPARATDELRWEFMAALEAATEAFVLERPLCDERAEPLRPSALYEETVDCYRTDITAQDDLDKRTGLPLAAWSAAEAPQAGEDAAVAPAIGEEEFAQLASPVGALDRAVLPMAAAQLLLADKDSAALLARDDLVLSPSSLELYLSCPARWFFERRLPTDAPDAAFDPLARGRFCHRVLQLFHTRLATDAGMARISADAREGSDALREADALLDACFDEARAESLAAARGTGPQDNLTLVAATPLEEQVFASIRRDLHDCIRRDALLPAAYVPLHHEWKFGDPVDRASGEPTGQADVPYAGVRLHGTIDRVDVDGEGHALVIDYKGGLGAGYELPRPKRGEEELPEGTDPLLPLHSQALMYATALMRGSDREQLTPRGALYLSYAKPLVKGFADPEAFAPGGAALLPERGGALSQDVLVQPLPDGQSGFLALLAHVEDVATEAVCRMRDGDIEPRPRFGALSCDTCPLTSCPKRVR